MTAPVLWHHDRSPVTPRTEIHTINNGDVTTVVNDLMRVERPAGDLWERVAESAEAGDR